MFTMSVVSGKSGAQVALIKLEDIFPTCGKLLKESNLPLLTCWTNPGSCNRGVFNTCMGELVTDVYKLFTAMPKLDNVVLWWKSPHEAAPGGLRVWGMVIDKDEDTQLRIAPLNKWALTKLKDGVGEKFSVNFNY